MTVGWIVKDTRLMVLNLLILAVLVLASEACACFEIEPTTPAERGAATHAVLGLVDQSLHLPHSVKSGGDNPGGITVYGFKPFGSEDIGFCAMWVNVPLSASGDGVSISYQRLAALSYAEETYLAAYRMCIGSIWCEPAVRIGTVRLDGRWVDWAALVDMTLGVRIREEMRMLLRLQNPLALGMMTEDSPCPSYVSAGLGYLVTERLAWGAEIRKYGGFPTSISTGVELSVSGRLILRTGIRTQPQEFCLGVGVRLGALTVESSASLNLDLGTTYEFGTVYIW
jgi:hypothetical protein